MGGFSARPVKKPSFGIASRWRAFSCPLRPRVRAEPDTASVEDLSSRWKSPPLGNGKKDLKKLRELALNVKS